MTVVGIIGQRTGMQHEQAAGSAAIVGDDGGLHTELVRGGGLAVADTLHLRGMEGIELPSALALLLGADLAGSAKGKRKRLLQCRLTFDLAADVANDPAKPAAQDAQLPLELLGMGVTARHHRRGLGHARIGLPQPDPVALGQAVFVHIRAVPKAMCATAWFGARDKETMPWQRLLRLPQSALKDRPPKRQLPQQH